jgi:hypothetical protein
VNQTRSHCVNQMGKTQSKALAERHGRRTAGERQENGRGTAGNSMGTAWERHGMCESPLKDTALGYPAVTYHSDKFSPNRSNDAKFYATHTET